MIATIARRIAGKAATRGLILAVGLGLSEVPLIDLRGKLPATGTYPTRSMKRVNAIVVHHSATRGQTIHSIAEFHTQTRGWPAIAYHFAVGWDGKVYILNNPETRTSHAAGFNTRSIGICLIGNYEQQHPTTEMINAAHHLVAYLRDKYGPLTVYWHSETKMTACPGIFAREALAPLKD